MCKILVNTNNKKFNFNELKQAFFENNDGTGVFYYDKLERKTHILKYVKGTAWQQIAKDIKNINNNKNICNVAIHFRWATSGEKTIEQIHPMALNNNIYLLHNGILNDFVWSDTISDTQAFAWWLDNTLKQHNIKTLEQLKNNKYLMAYLSHVCAGNKIVLCQHNNNLIINDNLGEYKKDIWRSWKEYSIINNNKCYYGGFDWETYFNYDTETQNEIKKK